MIKITDKTKCCGCGACHQICPKHCIEMKKDKEGFLYPKVDENICVDCHLCERICPYFNKVNSRNPLKHIAYINNNEDDHDNASSGGAFIAMAKAVIEKGGVVFGAVFDTDFRGCHLEGVEKEADLIRLMGSKYLQASVNNTFAECLAFLKKGRYVLFSGTPCQISGLRHFLKIDYDNLLLVDCMCHAVPSPAIWAKYCDYLSQGKSIKKVSFRDKKLNGWNNYSLKIEFSDGLSYQSGNKEDSYMRGFMSQLINRPSCSNCCATGFKSGSDITIGDFWNVEKYYSDKHQFLNNDGVSLLLFNTEKGEAFFEVLKNTGFWIEVPFKQIETDKSHKCLVGSEKMHRLRPVFFTLQPLVRIDFLINSCLSVMFFFRNLRKIIN